MERRYKHEKNAHMAGVLFATVRELGAEKVQHPVYEKGWVACGKGACVAVTFVDGTAPDVIAKADEALKALGYEAEG